MKLIISGNEENVIEVNVGDLIEIKNSGGCHIILILSYKNITQYSFINNTLKCFQNFTTYFDRTIQEYIVTVCNPDKICVHKVK